MSTTLIILALLIAGIVAFIVGIAKARSASNTPDTKMHSRLGYYGAYAGIWTVLPALILVLAWAGAEKTLITGLVKAELPSSIQELSAPQQNLIMNQVNAIAAGLPRLSAEDYKEVERSRLGFSPMSNAQTLLQDKGVVLGSAPEPFLISAAYDTAEYRSLSRWIITGIAAVLAILGFLYAIARIRPRLKARNSVEGVVKGVLIAASTVAILTTIGIISSVLFETINFFQKVSLSNFFFGTVWDPRFSSVGRELSGAEGQFGLIPLLWGTMFISIVALLVAVPIGLYAAIYMSEYASSRFRGVAKPVLEVLAGIPTIVYGLFALITFGPFLRDVGELVGLSISASSVLTAGIVMGIMIIPFVSSLSDDIISSVPQALREGSYGLGATKSETIRKVVLPAALPGIVGAVMLAASRAIGETMIVVLAAGIAANLTLNPLEPVTTITVKIVSQLTGDLEFNSPQTLVAFALGLTLFVVTLALNIYALYIVRKYREQYE
ncbi:MAG: phosphate ABC transporter permease subunit PstC [Pseudomonadota bacterium]